VVWEGRRPRKGEEGKISHRKLDNSGPIESVQTGFKKDLSNGLSQEKKEGVRRTKVQHVSQELTISWDLKFAVKSHAVSVLGKKNRGGMRIVEGCVIGEPRNRGCLYQARISQQHRVF